MVEEQDYLLYKLALLSLVYFLTIVLTDVVSSFLGVNFYLFLVVCFFRFYNRQSERAQSVYLHFIYELPSCSICDFSAPWR